MYHLYKNVRSTDLLRKGWPMEQHLRGLKIPETLFQHGWNTKKKLSQTLGQTSSNTKKLRECNYEQVDKTILKWFSKQSNQNIPIDGTMTQEKVLLFAKNFDLPTVKYSNSWIDKSHKGMIKYRTSVKKGLFF